MCRSPCFYRFTTMLRAEPRKKSKNVDRNQAAFPPEDMQNLQGRRSTAILSCV